MLGSHEIVQKALPSGLPGGSAGKESTCNAGDLSLIPGLGRSPGEGNGNTFRYSCLENSIDRGALVSSVSLGELFAHRGAKSCTQLK